MERDEFWKHIEAARSLDPDAPEIGLQDQLKELPLEVLLSFQEHFDRVFDLAYRWDLWGAAYLIEGGCSDDGFTDFRYGLIARGATTFGAALANPDLLVKIDDFIPNESFGYVAMQMIEEKSGDEDVNRYAPAPTDPAGQEWDFDDASEMAGRYPRLWARYGQ